MASTAPDMVFDFSGGHLALDFANTVSSRPEDPGSPRGEHLNDYRDLLSWSRQAGLIDEAESDRLAALASDRPEAAMAMLDRATALREAIYAIFSDGAAGRPPHSIALELLNAEIGVALSRARITWDGSTFTWGWRAGPDDLDPILWPVARAAADLLTSDDRARVRECAADRCAWLFLDRSHAGRRQWCDMKTCGNRAKARRHYARVKGMGNRE